MRWFYWNLIIHVECSLSYPTCFKIIEDQVHTFIATVFNGGNVIIQQDNVSWYMASVITVMISEIKSLLFCPGHQWSEILIPLSIYWICWTNKSILQKLHVTYEIKRLLLISSLQIPKKIFNGFVESISKSCFTSAWKTNTSLGKWTQCFGSSV